MLNETIFSKISILSNVGSTLWWLKRKLNKLSILPSFALKTKLFPISITFYLGSVRIPLQMTKCNHGPNSTYLSMNSFNNNNLTAPSVNDETTITTTDNLQPTTTIASQHWTRNLNGNSQRSSVSWRANKASLSLNLTDGSKAANQNSTDDLTSVNTNGGQKILQSPFDYPTKYRKTWI